MILFFMSGLAVFGQNCGGVRRLDPNSQLLETEEFNSEVEVDSQNTSANSKTPLKATPPPGTIKQVLTSKVIFASNVVDYTDKEKLHSYISDLMDEGATQFELLPSGELEVTFKNSAVAKKIVKNIKDNTPTESPSETTTTNSTPEVVPEAVSETEPETVPPASPVKVKVEYVKQEDPNVVFDPESIELNQVEDNIVMPEDDMVPVEEVPPNAYAIARQNLEEVLAELNSSRPKPAASASAINSKILVNVQNKTIGYDNSSNPYFPDIGDQRNAPASMAWSIGYYITSYNNARTAKEDIHTPWGQTKYLCSPSYVNGITGGGGSFKLSLEAIKTSGCAPFNKVNYASMYKGNSLRNSVDPDWFPDDEMQRIAQKFKMKSYDMISVSPMNDGTLDKIKKTIANGDLITTTINIYRNFLYFNGFESTKGVCANKTNTRFQYLNGIYSTLDSGCNSKSSEGLQTITIVGYDDEKKAFKIANSWGEGWGRRGFAWISYDLFKSEKFSASPFYRLVDFDKEPVLKNFIVIKSEISIPSSPNYLSFLYYKIFTDNLKFTFNYEKQGLVPIFRKFGTNLKKLSIFVDISDLPLADKLKDELVIISTKVVSEAGNKAWVDLYDKNMTHEILDMSYYRMVGNSPSGIRPFRWYKSGLTKPQITYPKEDHLFNLKSNVYIRPIVGSNIPMDAHCELKKIASNDLPKGLTLDPSTCAISGTPVGESPKKSVVIICVNEAGTSEGTVSLEVKDVAPVLSFAKTKYEFAKGDEIKIEPVAAIATGVFCTCNRNFASTLGITFNPLSCSISGKGLAGYTDNIVITAKKTSSTATTDATFSLTITVPKAPPPTLAYEKAVYKFDKAKPISVAPTNTLVTGTTCDIKRKSDKSILLPSGLLFDKTTCVLAGTPGVESKNEIYTVTATNESGSVSVDLDISVTQPAIVSLFREPSYTFRVGKNDIIPNLPKPADVTCEIISGAVPKGIVFYSSCILWGTPSEVSPKRTLQIRAKSPTATFLEFSVDVEVVK